ncbi:MAG: alpha-glucosidase, partial [Actinomycetota bacterium]|nr:alpha-glucosidase [Actinomycetota bacterium]
ELGLPGADIKPDEIVDPWGFQSPELSRDPARSPMPWTADRNGGFCSPDVTPWLPLVSASTTLCVESQDVDPDSFLSLTKRLLMARRSSEALRRGSLGSLAAIDDCVVFERRVPGDRRVVALNLSDASRTIEAEAFTGATVEVSTRRDRNDEKLEGELELMPLEGCIILPSH